MYLQKPPFETVYERYYRPVFHLVYMRLLHREDAEDVVADTFIKAMEAYERFDPTRASISTWLGRIAQNCTTDFLRRKGRRAEVGLDELPDAGAEDRELSALTDEATAQVYRLMQRSAVCGCSRAALRADSVVRQDRAGRRVPHRRKLSRQFSQQKSDQAASERDQALL